MKTTNSNARPNHCWTKALVGPEKTRPTRNFTLAAVLMGLTLVLAPARTSAITGKKIAQLSASDNGPNSYFGAAVAISTDGKTIAVAAPGADNGFGEEVYIYEKPADGWTNMTQVARLFSPNCPVTGAAGASIAITPDGGTIVYQCIDTLGTLAVGPINVFVRPASGWQDGRPPDANFFSPNGGGSFGSSLAVDPKGVTIATTGSTYDPDTNISSWFLYLFGEPASGWTNNMTPTQIESLGTAADDVAQASPIAMNNEWVVATNTWNSVLYLFRRTPTGLQGAGSITPSTNNGAALGFSLAINDSGIFAGGGYFTSSGMFFPDVFVFSYSPLTQVAQLIPPATPSSNGSPAVVALSGKHLLAQSFVEAAPALFVESTTGGWQTTSQPDLILNVPNAYESENGVDGTNTLAIAGNVVVSGNEWADPSNSGAAYVYRLKE